jgi:hypothetical protein
MRTPTRRRLAALLCLPLLAGMSLAIAPAAAARTPAVPAHLPVVIESLAAYVAQTACIPTIQPGTAKLARLLVRTYPGTTYGAVSSCGTNGTVSEHYEGRAIDWMVSIRNAGQRAAASAFITWLLATDRSRNKFAMARRLGVMYLIFNNRMWGAWSGTWEPYNNCAHQPQVAYDNSCHRTHVHISLGWNGATGRTTFWTGYRAATDFGPCRPRDLNWAGPRLRTNPKACPRYAKVRPAARASATKVALVTYSGVVMRFGSGGPAVSAVQRALRVRANGSFGSVTRNAVIGFQSRHRLSRTGTVDAITWRALLAAVN